MPKKQRPGWQPAPSPTTDRYLLGVAAHEADNLVEAASHFRAVLGQNPKNGQALRHLGVVLAKLGKMPEAEVLLRKAAALRPKDGSTLCDLAAFLDGTNRSGEAQEWLERAAKVDPTNPQVLQALAAMRTEPEQATEAINLLRTAIRAGAAPLETYLKCARLHTAKGEVDQAVDLLANALSKWPGNAPVLRALSELLLRSEQFDDARQVLSVLTIAEPDDVDAWRLLSITAFKTGDLATAERSALRLTELRPEKPEFWAKLASFYDMVDRDEEAQAIWKKAVATAPYDASLVVGLLNSAFSRGGVSDMNGAAWNLPERTLHSPEVTLQRAMALPFISSSEDEIISCRTQMRETLNRLIETEAKIPNLDKRVPHTNFFLGNHGLPELELMELTSRACLSLCPELQYTSAKLERKPVGNRRIRVGFLSAYLANHSVGRVLNRFLKELDREQFEVVLFEMPSTRQGGHEISRGYADRVVYVSDQLAEARSQIEHEQIDVLQFCDLVLDHHTNFLAYSRLAPIQCLTWGHPGTSGRASIDHWISCWDYDPAGNEKFYSENLVRLSKPPMIAHPLPKPEKFLTREELGLPEGTLYACLQTLGKLHPDFDSVLAEILQEKDDAKLLLSGPIQPYWVKVFTDRFGRAHPHLKDRLIVLPQLSSAKYLSVLTHCVASLDPSHFSGANTTMEAFSVGLPVVALPGEQLRGRQTLAYYNMMQMDELVAADASEYVNITRRLTRDDDFRNQQSMKIIERCPAIFGTTDITRELESFYRNTASEVIG